MQLISKTAISNLITQASNNYLWGYRKSFISNSKKYKYSKQIL